MRTIKLHHPTGHPYWQEGEFKIEMPDGTFFNKQQFTDEVPGWANSDYCESHRIILKDDGIYYQRCGASSGTGKTNYGDPFRIIGSDQYDLVVYVGEPLVMSEKYSENSGLSKNEMELEELVAQIKAEPEILHCIGILKEALQQPPAVNWNKVQDNVHQRIVRHSCNLRINFDFDFKFIAIIPAININRHSKEFEIEWLFWGLYIGL